MQIDKHKHHIQTALDSLAALLILLLSVHFLVGNTFSCIDTQRVTNPLWKQSQM